MQSDMHAFVIRIWCEARNEDGSIRLWRGAIEHVNTGRRLHFQDLAVALRLLQQESGIKATQTTPHPNAYTWRAVIGWLKHKLHRQ